MKIQMVILSIIILLTPGNMFAQTSAMPIPVPAAKHEYLIRTGVAYDAKENMFGMIKIQEPKSFFTPQTDQVTWWGEFKPFKTWGRPELEARWYSPDGKLVAKQQFKGLHCRLAKTTLKLKEMGLNPSEGNWRVDVHYKGKLLDSKPFMIFDPAKGQPQGAAQMPASQIQFPVASIETQYQQKEVHL